MSDVPFEEPPEMDWLDALADTWAERTNLIGMVKNVMHPMMLKPHAPEKVRRDFQRRMEEQMDAIVRLAFVEGAIEALDGLKAAGRLKAPDGLPDQFKRELRALVDRAHDPR